MTGELPGHVSLCVHALLCWRMALRGSAARMGDWKLVRPNSQVAQLYNLAEDVGETRDLLRQEPEVAARLLAALNGCEVSLEPNPLFVSGSWWSGYNRRLYERKFSLVQPQLDDDEDIWKLRARSIREPGLGRQGASRVPRPRDHRFRA